MGYIPLGGQTATEEKMTLGAEPHSFEISIPDSAIGTTFQYYFKLTDKTGITAYHPHNTLGQKVKLLENKNLTKGQHKYC